MVMLVHKLYEGVRSAQKRLTETLFVDKSSNIYKYIRRCKGLTTARQDIERICCPI